MSRKLAAWVVVSGDHIYGPFATADAAAKWADAHFADYTWSLRHLNAP